MRITKLKSKLLEQPVPAYQVAKMIGIHNSRLSEYANGQSISKKHLILMAEWFGCQPSDLIGWVEDESLSILP